VAGGARFGETAQDYSRKAASEKSEERDIKLPERKLSCQKCKLKCETQEKLDTYFHEQQREKLNAVLQENFKFHIQTVLELVMSEAKYRTLPKVQLPINEHV
jgi:hypothetical protein